MNNLFPQRDIGYLIILFKNVFISTVFSCLLPNLELCGQKISVTYLGKNVFTDKYNHEKLVTKKLEIHATGML